MAFDFKKHVIRVQGNREYLPVSARLIWFRSEHPDWGIVTQAVEINLEKQYAIFQASIFNAEGKLMATATKMENIKGFGDYIEKAETGSVGRALAYCGYGAQYAPELEESSRFGDAPRGGGNNGRYTRSEPELRSEPRPNPNYDRGPAPERREPPRENREPMPARPEPARMEARPEPSRPESRPEQRPEQRLEPARPPMNARADTPRPEGAPRPAPNRPVANDDDPFADETPLSRLPVQPASRLLEGRTPPPAPSEGRPAERGAPITRVREPERENPDPGGDGDVDDDPFAEDDFTMGAPAPARPAANGRPAPAPARRPQNARPESADSLLA